MKKLRRILTLGLALFMTLGLALPVSAANYTPIPGTETELYKYLVVNEDAEIPEATFNFTVSAGEAKEATATSVKVWAGVNPELVKVNGKVETGSVKFIAGEEATSTNAVNALGVDGAEGKKAAKKTIALDFSGVEFAEPGVYRYLITEAAPVAPIKAVDSRVTTVDVYVEYVAGQSGSSVSDPALEVKEYVAYEGDIANAGPLNDLYPWLEDNPMPVEPLEPGAPDEPIEPVREDFGNDEDFNAAHEDWELDHASWEDEYAQWEINHADWEAAMEQYATDLQVWENAYEAALGEVPNTAEAGEKDDKFVNEVSSANLEFGKETVGNQGSKNQYFKFTLELSNLGSNTMITMDMSKAENGVAHENAATSYKKADMEEANKRDDNAKWKFDGEEYDSKASAHAAAIDTIEEITEGENAGKFKFADDVFETEELAEAAAEAACVAPLDGQQIIADAQGNAAIEVYLHDGMYVKLKGLPEEATYRLIEEDAAGYTKIEKITQAVNGTRAYEDAVSGTIGAKMEEKAEHWTYAGQEFATLAEANAAAVDAGAEMPAEGQPASGVEYHEATSVKAKDQDVYTGYTNNREGLIPTGLLVSVGTPLAIGAAAVGLFLAKRKKEDEE